MYRDKCAEYDHIVSTDCAAEVRAEAFADALGEANALLKSYKIQLKNYKLPVPLDLNTAIYRGEDLLTEAAKY